MRGWSTKSPDFFFLVALCVGALGGCSSESSFRRGNAGESCRARNDCASGLACVKDVCVVGGSDLSVTGKSCYRVECEADADCCAAFVPGPECDLYEDACQANPEDCDAFRLFCQCNRVCEEAICIDTGPACSMDEECPGLTSPYCVDTRCVECREHGDCLGEKERCIEGTCTEPCESDEQCPLLHTCDAGTCILSGCTSDRECVFVLGHPNGRCAESECYVGCVEDAECDASAFEVCHEGRCTFIGCESDAECRAYLDLSEPTGNARAECR